MKGDAMTKHTVFISYSHEDEDCKDRLVTHLGVLQQEGILDLWDDRRIGAGEDWYQDIREAIDAASVAVLMVSANFLTSNFILHEEVPRLLERRDGEGMCIFPVIIKPCAWKHVKWLARMNMRPKDGTPISGGDAHQIDADMTAIADEVAAIIENEQEDSDGVFIRNGKIIKPYVNNEEIVDIIENEKEDSDGLFTRNGKIIKPYENNEGDEDIKYKQGVFSGKGKIVSIFERNNTPRGGQ